MRAGKRITRSIIFPAGLLLLPLLLVCPSCPSPEDGTLEEELLKTDINQPLHGKEKAQTLVVSTRLSTGPIQSFIDVSSDVEPVNQVEIYPLLSGLQIMKVFAEEGDFVEKGAELAVLDNREITLELAQAKVAHIEANQRLEKSEVAKEKVLEKIKAARIQAEKAKKDYDKSLKMLEEELIAEDEFDTTRLSWEQAASDLDLAVLQEQEADLDLALSRTQVEKSRIEEENVELRLTRTRITAPFNAFVTYRGATVGMTISSASHLFTLVDNRELVVDLYIPQEELLSLRVGLPVEFTCDALPGTIFTGSVTIINPAVDSDTGTIKVRARIDLEEGNLLRPGLFVMARIVTASREKALLIPRKAVFYDDQKPTFFLIEEDNSVRKVHFVPGATTQNALEIASVETGDVTVAEGARIVIIGQDNLKNGDQVKIAEEIL